MKGNLKFLLERFPQYKIHFNEVNETILILYKNETTCIINLEDNYEYHISYRDVSGEELPLVVCYLESFMLKELKKIRDLGIDNSSTYRVLINALKQSIDPKPSLQINTESNKELKDLILELRTRLGQSNIFFTVKVPFHYSNYSSGYPKKSCFDSLKDVESKYNELLRFTESLQQNYNCIIAEYTTWKNSISELLSKLIGKL